MIDVIIPCYNAEKTLSRAVNSVLKQKKLNILWIIDDCSIDSSYELAKNFANQFPNKIKVEKLSKNSGVAKARNWGAINSESKFIAFLDADDEYEENALDVAMAIFEYKPETCLVRLDLKPINIDEKYINHPNFNFAWQHMKMTCGGNIVFNRAFFLACGGFPQNDLFKKFGGEDGALGIATTKIGLVATAFNNAGVLHHCRKGMHAERLLDTILFKKTSPDISENDISEANQITDNICISIKNLTDILNTSNIGICPFTVEERIEKI